MGHKAVSIYPPAFAPIEDLSFESFEVLPPERILPSGVTLHEQGEFPASLYLIRSGVVKLVYTRADGSQTMLGLRSSGWISGVAHTLTNTICTASAVTITACKVSVFDPMAFRARLAAGDPVCFRIVCMMAQELVSTRELVKQVMSSSAEQRLQAYLDESKPDAANRNIDTSPLLRQAEIAQLLGITPEHLSRLHQKARMKADTAH
jgi:CRP-like cAMP-binding protein